MWCGRSRAAALPVFETPMRGDLAVGEAFALGRWMRKQGVEVVLTKLHKGIRVSGLASLFGGRPPVAALMGLVEVERGLRYRLTYRLFLDWIVTLSPAMRDAILAVDAGPRPERIVAIPYGVDLAACEVPEPAAREARASLGAAPGDLLVVAVGRLHAQKRFDRMIEAFAGIRERVPAARLAIVGTGSLHTELEGRARSAGVGDRVTFAGFRSDTAAVFAAADLFALSSDDEGLPMVVIEAMAAGLPVVATDVGSVRDLVADGETGRLVAREAAPLAAAVAGLLLDPDARRRMGAAGRARVEERYGLERCVAETEAFLHRVRAR
jgi:glycosyltransferase involved in cell wall biosynthesis